jgi:ketosteroid isomerase-like protein
MMLQDTIKDFYVSLLAGDVDALTDVFIDQPLVNTPLQGEVKGTAAFKKFVEEQQTWLEEREANPELFDLTATDERIVAEFVLNLGHAGETIDLPVAVVADLVDGGISAVRVYHSTWPLTGEHVIRAPLLEPAEGLEEPEIIEAYMAGIGGPDKEAVLALFAEDGYVREPSGAGYKHVGPEGLRHFYDPALDSGGVVLHHCTATFDGRTFAVEYICDEWANVKLPPQAGLAVYELAGPEKLQAARIYDDVTPPFE